MMLSLGIILSEDSISLFEMLSTDPVDETVDPTPDQDPASVTAPDQLQPSFIRSEIWLHSLFFAMAASVLLMSFLMRSEGETQVYMPGFDSPMPETCSARRMFGIDCPGCGMTRAFISISSGRFARAWHFNPASFIVYLFVAVQIPWHVMQIWRLLRKGVPIVTAWAYLAPIGVVVFLSIHWVWRLVVQF